MSSFQLKMVALTAMIVGHVGLFFFPNLLILQIIGRIAFPIFAWLIASGAMHTRNISRYLLRIFAFAVIAQVPYLLMTHVVEPDVFRLNTLFTFCLALLAIMVLKKTKRKLLSIFPIVIGAMIAEAFFFDYGAVGFLTVIAFWLFRRDNRKIVVVMTVLFTAQALSTLPSVLPFETVSEALKHFLVAFSLFALIPILHFDGTEGRKTGYLLYIIYPLHLIVLLLLRAVLGLS